MGDDERVGGDRVAWLRAWWRLGAIVNLLQSNRRATPASRQSSCSGCLLVARTRLSLPCRLLGSSAYGRAERTHDVCFFHPAEPGLRGRRTLFATPRSSSPVTHSRPLHGTEAAPGTFARPPPGERNPPCRLRFLLSHPRRFVRSCSTSVLVGFGIAPLRPNLCFGCTCGVNSSAFAACNRYLTQPAADTDTAFGQIQIN